MKNHLNLGPHYAAARHDTDMENTDFTEMELAELDRIAQQLEWDVLTDIDTTTITHTCEHQYTHIIPGDATVEEPTVLYSHSPHENYFTVEETITEPPFLGSPDETSTTTSLLETPPMPNHELPADWAAAWDFDDALSMNMIPGFLDFPLDMALEWPVIPTVNVWADNGSNSAAAPIWGGQCSEDNNAPQSDYMPAVPEHPAETRLLSATTTTSPAATFESPKSQATIEQHLTCSFCPFTTASITKLKTHTNKHTRPFRCTAPECDYATAEKKSLQRHVLAKAKWDDGHRVAAEGLGVREVKYRCVGAGCGYVTIREDNLRRHVAKCPAMV